MFSKKEDAEEGRELAKENMVPKKKKHLRKKGKHKKHLKKKSKMY